MGLLDFFRRLFSASAGGSSTDKKLRCAQCGQDFVFEAGEQAFFKERGFQEPKRCPRCRKEHRSGGRFRRR